MTKAKLLEDLEDLSFIAGMNQRYHQALAGKRGRCDRQCKIAVGLLTVAACVVAVPSLFAESIWIGVVSVVVAVTLAGVGVILDVLRFGRSEHVYLDLFRRWSDLRQDVDVAKVRVEQTPAKDLSDELYIRVQELTGKKSAISALEPDVNELLLEKCCGDENRSRTGFRTQAEKDAHQEATRSVAA